jgi:Nitrate/nitrite transporter
MAVADAAITAPLSDAEHSRQLRRAVVASTIGTAIEWYDFFLYSVVTGLVFAKLFFPGDDPLTGTLNAFGIYFVGFLARPIGAAIFGHYGDRIGRKSTLIITLMLMGIATFLVALVPTYDQVGIWGAIILTVLRFIQGIGVGGEWGGSVLMSMEWCKNPRLARLHRVMAAVRRTLRVVPRQFGGARLQRDVGRSVPDRGAGACPFS